MGPENCLALNAGFVVSNHIESRVWVENRSEEVQKSYRIR